MILDMAMDFEPLIEMKRERLAALEEEEADADGDGDLDLYAGGIGGGVILYERIEADSP